MDANLILKVRGTGDRKAVEGEAGGEIYVVVCGTQLDGTITPLLCDADGKLVVTS
jgi:hypothetical protein